MDFLFVEVISKPLWLWLMFLTIVVTLMIFDLGVLHKEDHEIGVAESLKLSAFYITIAIAFGGYIWWAWSNGTLVTSDGTNPVASYFQGYIIEKVLSIDNVGSNAKDWRPFDVNEPVGFTIAGADKKFVAAKASIRKDGSIEVSSEAVADPVAVRYGWADNPVCNMYSSAGLPLTPPEWLEWGDPITDPKAYETMLSYSPYDNVKAQAYPAILALGGLTDPRVTYWEPAKWVARLRATMTGGGPVLLKTNMDAGHGGASGRFDSLKDTALEFAFAIAAVKQAGRLA
jgi:hypothetical protein